MVNGRLDELIREGKYPDPMRYYEFLYNKITIKMLPRHPDQMVKEEFSVVLAKNWKYEQVCLCVMVLMVGRCKSRRTFTCSTDSFTVYCKYHRSKTTNSSHQTNWPSFYSSSIDHTRRNTVTTYCVLRNSGIEFS